MQVGILVYRVPTTCTMVLVSSLFNNLTDLLVYDCFTSSQTVGKSQKEQCIQWHKNKWTIQVSFLKQCQ